MVEEHPLVAIQVENDESHSAVEGDFIFELFYKPNAEKIIERIKDGCDVNKLNRTYQKRPIDFAVESLCKENIEALLSEPTVNIDQKCPAWSRMTPINYLADRIQDCNFKEVFACIKILIEHLANVNIPDGAGITPIWRLLTSQKLSNANKRIVLAHLFENAIGVDIDNYQEGEIRKFLEEKFVDLKLPVVRIRNNEEKWDYDRLKNSLDHFSGSAEKTFLLHVNYILEWNVADLQQLFQMHDGEFTLLTRAVSMGLKRATERLLRLGADINYKGSYNSDGPIQWACERGYWEILEMLLRSPKIKTDCVSVYLILMNLEMKPNKNETHKQTDYEKCFQIVMNLPAIALNHEDINKSFGFALVYDFKPEIILALLNKGAYIGGDLHEAPIAPDVLEKCFDSCIRLTREAIGMAGVSEFAEIEFNYMNLMRKTKLEMCKGEAYSKEMEAMVQILSRDRLCHLLKHPLIQSFLYIKWQRLARIFDINLCIYLIFSVCVLVYILTNYLDGNDSKTVSSFSWWISLFMTFVLILRELTQSILSPRIYWTSMANYVEIALLVMVLFILSQLDVAGSHRRMIVATIIPLLTFELFILLGSRQIFSVHFEMLKSVLISFIKAFSLYVIILVAFALSFFAVLGSPQTAGNNTNVEASKNPESFGTVGLSLMKTIVMATGEFDAGSIDFDSNPFSYFLFLAFLLLVSTVLFNLLNGLAVTDIQEVKTDAELRNLQRRANLLAKYEEILRSNHLCRSILDKWIGPHRLSIFKLLPSDKIIVRIYDSNKIYRVNSRRWNSDYMSKDLFNPIMPRNIMDLAEHIVNKKRMQQHVDSEKYAIHERISKIEDDLKENRQQLHNIQESLNILGTNLIQRKGKPSKRKPPRI